MMNDRCLTPIVSKEFTISAKQLAVCRNASSVSDLITVKTTQALEEFLQKIGVAQDDGDEVELVSLSMNPMSKIIRYKGEVVGQLLYDSWSRQGNLVQRYRVTVYLVQKVDS